MFSDREKSFYKKLSRYLTGMVCLAPFGFFINDGHLGVRVLMLAYFYYSNWIMTSDVLNDNDNIRGTYVSSFVINDGSDSSSSSVTLSFFVNYMLVLVFFYFPPFIGFINIKLG